MCACAEYWLPDGTENVLDYLNQLYGDEEEEEREENVDDHDAEGNKNETKDETDTQETPSQGPGGEQESTSNTGASNTTSMDISDHISSPPRPPLPQSISASSSSAAAAVAHQASLQRGLTPMTPPPNANQSQYPLSPPSPPGRRYAGGLTQQQQEERQQRIMPQPTAGSASASSSSQQEQQQTQSSNENALSSSSSGHNPIPLPPNTAASAAAAASNTTNPLYKTPSAGVSGRFVPHVVTISLDTNPFLETHEETVPKSVGGGGGGSDATATTTTATTTVVTTTLGIPGRGAYAMNHAHTNPGGSTNATKPLSRKLRPRLGQVLEASPLDGAKASAVTCVKFSPSTDFCLIGYGVREPVVQDHNGNQHHPVVALYKVRGGMTHVSTMLSSDDDVNISRFHPESGYGFVYGTKQGRVRDMGPRPWNYYDC